MYKETIYRRLVFVSNNRTLKLLHMKLYMIIEKI